MEPRKYTTQTPTRLICAEGKMDGSDNASSYSVRRGRRPHSTCRNFMHENRVRGYHASGVPTVIANPRCVP